MLKLNRYLSLKPALASLMMLAVFACSDNKEDSPASGNSNPRDEKPSAPATPPPPSSSDGQVLMPEEIERLSLGDYEAKIKQATIEDSTDLFTIAWKQPGKTEDILKMNEEDKSSELSQKRHQMALYHAQGVADVFCHVLPSVGVDSQPEPLSIEGTIVNKVESVTHNPNTLLRPFRQIEIEVSKSKNRLVCVKWKNIDLPFTWQELESAQGYNQMIWKNYNAAALGFDKAPQENSCGGTISSDHYELSKLIVGLRITEMRNQFKLVLIDELDAIEKERLKNLAEQSYDELESACEEHFKRHNDYVCLSSFRMPYDGQEKTHMISSYDLRRKCREFSDQR